MQTFQKRWLDCAASLHIRQQTSSGRCAATFSLTRRRDAVAVAGE